MAAPRMLVNLFLSPYYAIYFMVIVEINTCFMAVW